MEGDKISLSRYIETLNAYIIYIQEVLTRIEKHVPADKILFYEQAVYKRSTKMVQVVQWLWLGEDIFTIQRIEMKETKMDSRIVMWTWLVDCWVLQHVNPSKFMLD